MARVVYGDVIGPGFRRLRIIVSFERPEGLSLNRLVASLLLRNANISYYQMVIKHTELAINASKQHLETPKPHRLLHGQPTARASHRHPWCDPGPLGAAFKSN